MSSCLEKVHPELKKRVLKLIANLAVLGHDVRVHQSLRTAAEQNALYAQGRTKPGKKVTAAKAWQSNHNYGLAVDLVPFINGQFTWDRKYEHIFQLIGREAKKLGLEWGGDWRSVDMPHVQLKGLSIKECYALYLKGGLQKVWSRMYEILGGAAVIGFVPAEDDILEFRDRGDAVKALQQQLVKLNFLRLHEVDSEFGKITKNAVIGFQRQNGLTADGIVGDGTKSKLKSAIEKLESKKVSEAVQPSRETSDISPNNEQPPNPDPNELPETNPVSEVEKTVEKTTDETGKTEVKTSVSETLKTFDPKNIPAFIPRFGKQWFLSLIPGGGLIATIAAKVSAMPDWLVFTLGFFTGVTTVLFFQLLIKHREKVWAFVQKCYEITANPEMHNLIPTNAAGFIGQRKAAILSSLVDKKQGG